MGGNRSEQIGLAKSTRLVNSKNVYLVYPETLATISLLQINFTDHSSTTYERYT